MEPHYVTDDITLYQAEALDVLPTIADESVDAIVCDPPYALTELPTATVTEALASWLSGDRGYIPATGRGFMGREWDRFVPPPAVWDECLRVLKPGGHLLAFAGARTVDLMGLSIRLSGFQVRDSIDWIYGSGMPKGKHQLKPTHEPIIMARRPLDGTLAATINRHGTGGLNIDSSRIKTHEIRPKDKIRRPHDEFGTFKESGGGTRSTGNGAVHAAGRWPTNVLLTHPPLLDEHGQPVGDACADGCVNGCPIAELDQQTAGMRASKPSKSGSAGKDGGRIYGAGNGLSARPEPVTRDDTGASRFFPVFRYDAKAPKSERPRLPDGTAWPTVKPLALMRWLVRLVAPPGGTVLDWCTGTGTTLEAARLEGMRSIGVEREPDGVALCRTRLRNPYVVGLFGDGAA